MIKRLSVYVGVVLMAAVGPQAAFARGDAAVYARGDAAVYARGDAARGSAAVQVCTACHGADGNSVLSANPNLAGQHGAYIAKQLANFKKGERVSPIMAPMVAALTAEAMDDIGAFYAGQTPRARAARDEALVKDGEKIYRGGVAVLGVPACAGCHGPSGAGIPAQYPRLAGQYQEYTSAQLKAFRAGARANDPAKMMRMVAARLSDQDIDALAEYIAGLR